MGFLWNEIIMKPMVNILTLFYSFLSDNFGLSIIVFTILIRVLMIPISFRQVKQMLGMQSIQPKIKKIQEIKEDQQVKLKDERQKLKDKARERLSTIGIEVDDFVFNAMKKYLEPLVFNEVKPVALKYAGESEVKTVNETMNKAKEVIMSKKALTIQKGQEAVNNSKFREVIEKLATLTGMDEDLKKGTLSSLEYAPQLQFRRVRNAIVDTSINEIVDEALKTEGWDGQEKYRSLFYCNVM